MNNTILDIQAQDKLSALAYKAELYKKTTDKYQSRTSQILNAIEYLKQKAQADNLDFRIEVGATSRMARKSTKHAFLLKLGQGDLVPTIAFRDSLNGESATFIDFGVYRKVCSNGLHLATSELTLERKNHIGTWELSHTELDKIYDFAMQSVTKLDKFKAIPVPVTSEVVRLRNTALKLLAEFGHVTEGQASRAIRHGFRRYDADGTAFGLLNSIQEALTTNRNGTKKQTEANSALNRALVPAIESVFTQMQIAA